jgi:hypothetical protein
MTSASRTILLAFLASTLFGHANAAGPEFFAVAVAAPTTNDAEIRHLVVRTDPLSDRELAALEAFQRALKMQPAAETQRTSIAQFIQGLPRRNVYLKAENTMVRDRAHTVQAGLTLGDAQALATAMSGPGKLTVVDPVPVAPEMSATLSGDGFQVTSSSPPKQFVDPARPTLWQWQVVPTKTGKLKLLLRVAVVVTLPGLNTESEYQVKEQEIIVIVGFRGRLESILGSVWAVAKWFLVGIGGLALPEVWKRCKRLFGFKSG